MSNIYEILNWSNKYSTNLFFTHLFLIVLYYYILTILHKHIFIYKDYVKIKTCINSSHENVRVNPLVITTRHEVQMKWLASMRNKAPNPFPSIVDAMPLRGDTI